MCAGGVLPAQLAEVGARPEAAPAGPGDRRGLGGRSQVGVQEVGRARGEHAAEDVAAPELPEEAGHRAVPAREHDEVEVLRVREALVPSSRAGQHAHHALVALFEQGALELEDRVRPEAGSVVVDYEAAHADLRRP